jgi:hypothetical protein
MFSVIGKVKTWAIAALTAALPIIYFFGRFYGRMKGKQEAEMERVEDANKTASDIADFYKEMADDEQITEGNLHNRDRLSKRLRDKGL